MFEIEQTLEKLPAKIALFRSELSKLEGVGEIRQCGMMAGIDLLGGDGTLGAKACLAARGHGLLTRPVLDTVVLMPPLAIGEEQIVEMVEILGKAIEESY